MTTFNNKMDKLERMIEYIRRENTGNAIEFANKIAVSRSTLFRYIDDLKAMGYNIGFCLSRRTFYFIENTEVRNRFKSIK
jgi:predicted DNA-binding transcriptional regulator YafY